MHFMLKIWIYDIIHHCLRSRRRSVEPHATELLTQTFQDKNKVYSS